MGLLKSLTGTVKVDLTSADLASSLTAINSAGIDLYDAVQIDDLTVRLTLYRRDYRHLAKVAERRGEKLRMVRRLGLYWTGKNLVNRPMLIVGLAILLMLVLFLPTRILFVRVEGNINVPTRLIIAQAESCGIGFGTSRREVRSERMKNKLLAAIPELQWAGVNTSGCVATISVRERSEAEPVEKLNGVSSIVAIRDGIITEATILRGNALCKVGQAVTAGEVLVSGYTDCGICIQATRAEAEIFAQTKRYFVVQTPDECIQRGAEIRTEKKYSLRFGKKQINFYKDSGILDSSCDKMYSENYMTLPGGFQLPIALVVQTVTYYDCQTIPVSEDGAQQTMQSYARMYLQSQMVAGQILEQRETAEEYCLYGEYACLELIGREQSEEIIQSNGEDN